DFESRAHGSLPKTGNVGENSQRRHPSEFSDVNPPHLQGQTIGAACSCRRILVKFGLLPFILIKVCPAHSAVAGRGNRPGARQAKSVVRSLARKTRHAVSIGAIDCSRERGGGRWA